MAHALFVLRKEGRSILLSFLTSPRRVLGACPNHCTNSYINFVIGGHHDIILNLSHHRWRHHDADLGATTPLHQKNVDDI
jgi:hypothetical protein